MPRNTRSFSPRVFCFLQAKMSWHLFGFLPLFLTFLVLVSGEPCIDAKATSKVYSTSNVLLATESVFLVESIVKCSNNPKDIFLYAEIDGNLYPVPKSGDDSVHQFSWVKPHKKAISGAYVVNYYDEEGYAALRKAQRSEEKSEQKPLFSVTLNHRVNDLVDLVESIPKLDTIGPVVFKFKNPVFSTS